MTQGPDTGLSPSTRSSQFATQLATFLAPSYRFSFYLLPLSINDAGPTIIFAFHIPPFSSLLETPISLSLSLSPLLSLPHPLSFTLEPSPPKLLETTYTYRQPPLSLSLLPQPSLLMVSGSTAYDSVSCFPFGG